MSMLIPDLKHVFKAVASELAWNFMDTLLYSAAEYIERKMEEQAPEGLR